MVVVGSIGGGGGGGTVVTGAVELVMVILLLLFPFSRTEFAVVVAVDVIVESIR